MKSRSLALLLVSALIASVAGLSVLVGCSSPSNNTSTPSSTNVTAPSNSEETSENDSIESTAEEGVEASTTATTTP